MKNVKLIKICFLFAIAVMLQIKIVTAQNLVPNPSFEEYIACPEYFHQTYLVNDWIININSADYFNKCSVQSEISIPINNNGFQDTPNSECNAYMGIVTYHGFMNNNREYFGTILNTPLLIYQQYYISFKVSLANNSSFATDKLGVLFTNENFENISSAIPFVENTNLMNNFAHVYSENIISDTNNWVTVKGSFLSDSSYQNIIIGNFFDDENTNITNINSLYSLSYYYIDDVCVSTDSAYCWNYAENCNQSTIDNIELQQKVIIFPNPAKNQINVEIQYLNNIEKNYLKLYDVYGRLVLEKPIICLHTVMNTEFLKPGEYYIYINLVNKLFIRKLFVN